MMYKGYTIQPYSPKAGTAISSHELNQPGTYQDVTDTTVTAQFKLVEKDLPEFLQTGLETFVLAWTTTPGHYQAIQLLLLDQKSNIL